MSDVGRLLAIQAYCELGLMAIDLPHTINPLVLIIIKALLKIGQTTSDLATAEIVADSIVELFDAINNTGDDARSSMNWLQSSITGEIGDERY